MPPDHSSYVAIAGGSGTFAGIKSAHVVPVEAVLAVVSVKAQLRSDSVRVCADAAAQLRGLIAQEVPAVPVPAVFAIGFAGLQRETLAEALTAATDRVGADSRLDGLLILGERLAAPSLNGYDVDDDGADAHGRWIPLIDDAIERAPRRRAEPPSSNRSLTASRRSNV